jgi:hypothetical protein
MQIRVIQSSPLKTGLLLAGCLVFVGVGGWAYGQSTQRDWGMLLAIAFFGLGIPIAAILLVRPQRLTLDSEGFTLSGGLMLKPRTTLWSEVTAFSVFRLPRGGKMIGYNLIPAKEGMTTRLSRRLSGFDGGLPKMWSESAEGLAEELNAYRNQALLESGNHKLAAQASSSMSQ